MGSGAFPTVRTYCAQARAPIKRLYRPSLERLCHSKSELLLTVLLLTEYNVLNLNKKTR